MLHLARMSMNMSLREISATASCCATPGGSRVPYLRSKWVLEERMGREKTEQGEAGRSPTRIVLTSRRGVSVGTHNP